MTKLRAVKKTSIPLIHSSIWLLLFSYPFLFHYAPLENIYAVARITLFLFMQIGFFYLNTAILIPRILTKKRKTLYFFLVVLSIIFHAFSAGYIQVLFNPEYENKLAIFSPAFNAAIVTSILVLLISTSIKTTSQWQITEQKLQSVVNEKLNAELNFLKSQTNPHFLLNALNNIYALENKKSPDTGSAILKLSELIRYMLYESASDFVALNKEMNYLENYIELQKLGLGNEIPLTFIKTGEFYRKNIRPTLLITLIENVFKHGVNHAKNHPLFISVKVEGDQLELITENAYSEREEIHNGIGLINLEKRLKLLYPGKHKLNIFKKNGIFTAHLKIQLK